MSRTTSQTLSVILFAALLVSACGGGVFNTVNQLLASRDGQTETVIEALDGAESAVIEINLPVGTAEISALDADSPNLFEGELRYVGELSFTVTGEAQRRITVVSRTPPNTSVNNDDGSLRWTIGLHPGVPMELEVSGGVGDSTIDLTGLQITELEIEAGVSDTEVVLPFTGSDYAASIEGGVGDITVTVPEELGVEVTITSGVGDANIPSSWQRTADTGSVVGEGGTWRSPNYDTAEARAIVSMTAGVGTLTVR